MNIKIYKEWEDLKAIYNSNALYLFYEVIGTKYHIWLTRGDTIYYTTIRIETPTPSASDQLEFEEVYKDKCNAIIRPISKDGKEIVRSESRPLNTTTCFTTIGDSVNNIGDGKEISWDFSNDSDETSGPSGLKRKRLEFKFKDSVWVKEGTIYFFNAPKGCYLDLYVVCPNGEYYYDNDGVPHLATEDIPISHYVIHHMLQGNVPMGDELNTESCSSEIPNNYKFWLEITTDSNDITSNGCIEVELYRERTVIL